jgi:hypothetical protein
MITASEPMIEVKCASNFIQCWEKVVQFKVKYRLVAKCVLHVFDFNVQLEATSNATSHRYSFERM